MSLWIPASQLRSDPRVPRRIKERRLDLHAERVARVSSNVFPSIPSMLADLAHVFAVSIALGTLCHPAPDHAIDI